MKKLFLIIISVSLFATPFFCQASENIFYMSQGKEKEGIASFNKNFNKIDILAPQFYTVSDKLKLAGSLDANLKKVINQKKVRVMPLVTNAGFKQDLIHDLLVSTTWYMVHSLSFQTRVRQV